MQTPKHALPQSSATKVKCRKKESRSEVEARSFPRDEVAGIASAVSVAAAAPQCRKLGFRQEQVACRVRGDERSKEDIVKTEMMGKTFHIVVIHVLKVSLSAALSKQYLIRSQAPLAGFMSHHEVPLLPVTAVRHAEEKQEMRPSS